MPHRQSTVGALTLVVTLLATGCGGGGDDLTNPDNTNVASVRVIAPVDSAAVGGSASFRAEALDAGGVVLDPADNAIVFSWSSGDPAIATIAPDGTTATDVATATAVGTGPVTITVSAHSGGQTDSKQGTATLVVLPIDLVVLSPALDTVELGATTTLTAGAFLADDSQADVRFQWSTSNPNVVELPDEADQNPASLAVIAENLGTATVTATVGGKSASATIVVVSGRTVVVSGRVIDGETQAGIAGATIAYNGLTEGSGTAVTGADGGYSFNLGNNQRVIVTASAAGYVTTQLGGDVGAEATTLAPIPLVHESSSPGAISGAVLNARDNQPIPGATVRLIKNIDFNDSEIATTTSDASGGYTFTSVAAGTYTIKATASGFNAGSRTGIVVGNNTVNGDQNISLSPSGAGDIRVVLTWGADPGDLDSHLNGPGFHVFYDNRGSTTAAPFAALDVDDVTSFGPETITITQLNGLYRYSVHNYSDRDATSSTGLAGSGARVDVYGSSGLLQTLFVPNQEGTLWTVFELSGTIAQPVVTPINTMSYVVEPAVATHPKKGGR